MTGSGSMSGAELYRANGSEQFRYRLLGDEPVRETEQMGIAVLNARQRLEGNKSKNRRET
jgi:hypothetical protein